MPHLSPMLWALSSLMFIFILLTINSTLWWSHSPIFPSIPSSSANLCNPAWSWS
uniref:ATP synthase F0 subunit 8 n=1 Tax=Struwela camposi TaxID=2859449 RepID=UPI0030FEB705